MFYAIVIGWAITGGMFVGIQRYWAAIQRRNEREQEFLLMQLKSLTQAMLATNARMTKRNRLPESRPFTMSDHDLERIRKYSDELR